MFNFKMSSRNKWESPCLSVSPHPSGSMLSLLLADRWVVVLQTRQCEEDLMLNVDRVAKGDRLKEVFKPIEYTSLRGLSYLKQIIDIKFVKQSESDTKCVILYVHDIKIPSKKLFLII